MSTIDDLKNKVQRLTDQLKVATASLQVAEKAASPFQPGDIVERKSRRGEVTQYRVARLGHRYGNLRIFVTERRKNGGWMAREKDFGFFDELTKVGHEALEA